MYDRSRLLDLTSRTYALTIPFLPEPSRRYFSIAYLIMRTSDTFEASSEAGAAMGVSGASGPANSSCPADEASEGRRSSLGS